MGTKDFLIYGIQVVTCLFGAFGGFLIKVAPPDQTNVKAIVGTTEFLALIILLIIKAVSRTSASKNQNKRWLSVGILFFVFAIAIVVAYIPLATRTLYEFPPGASDLYVVGDLTPKATAYMARHPELFPDLKQKDQWWVNLQNAFDYREIFTAGSIHSAGLKLSCLYALLILALTTSVFCLLEANASSP